jgi:hypothetical protein
MYRTHPGSAGVNTKYKPLFSTPMGKNGKFYRLFDRNFAAGVSLRPSGRDPSDYNFQKLLFLKSNSSFCVYNRSIFEMYFQNTVLYFERLPEYFKYCILYPVF